MRRKIRNRRRRLQRIDVTGRNRLATAAPAPVSMAATRRCADGPGEPMSTQFLIPIFMFGCITYVAKQLIDARMRILMLRAGGSDDLIRSILEGEALQRRYASLRSGITLIALAAGFALIDLFGSRDITPGAIAVLAAAVGIGNLAYFALTNRR
jgi:hypothetical protein